MPIVKEISKGLLEQNYCGFIGEPKLHKPEISRNEFSVFKSRLHEKIQEHLIEKLTTPKKEFGDILSNPPFDKIMQFYKFGGMGEDIFITQEKEQIIEIDSYSSEKAKVLNSGDTFQKEQVKDKMTSYNPNRVPTEKQFYSQLTQEEKRDWDTLPQDTKQFVLEAMTPEGQRLIEKLNHKLDSCIEKVEKLTFFGI